MVRRPLTLELGLLGYLQQGPLHGYQIYQLISDPSGLNLVWKLKQAHLYSSLVRLDEAGYIAGSIQQQETRPARRVYRLTGKGEAALQEWLSSPVNTPRQMRQEFQIKVYFARVAGNESLGSLVHQQRAVCQQWLDAQLALAAQSEGLNSFTHAVYQYRAGQIRATLTWLDALETDL
jgi:DNA-binding PadR family transcriptional regulator